MLPSTQSPNLAESTWVTYILSCPWCDEALFHLESVPDTPFLAHRASDPTIQSKDGKLFCVCPQCAAQVDVWSEAGAVQVPDRTH